MKKSKSLPKKMQVMCVNNKCTAWLSPTEVPLDKISYYKCPRCKSSMRKHSIKVADKLRSKENKKNEKILNSNPQNNNSTNLQNNSENNDKYAPLAVIPILIFLHWKNPDWETTKFFKAYGFNIFIGLLLVGLTFSLLFLIFKYLNKKRLSVNTRSFHSLNTYYHDGNFSRIIKQALITFPILYFIKIRADQLVIFDLSSAIEKAELSYGLIFVPFLICYFLIKTEFMNTNYDYKGDEFVDKASAVQRMGIRYGIFYGIFGWILAFLIDWFIIGLRIGYIIIMDL
jgi:hypothetical protein